MKLNSIWREISKLKIKNKISDRIVSSIKYQVLSTKKYFSKERIIAFSMLLKIASLIGVLAFSPLAASAIDNNSQDNTQLTTNIKFTSNQSFPIVIEYEKIKIEPGKSNEQIETEREKNERTEELKNKRIVLARERDNRPAPYDPDLSKKRELVKKAANQYNIDWKILEAVWEVESGKSWDTSTRSYAGATGPMQFMPSTFRNNAMDGNGDGQTEITNAEDAVYSAAHLLANSGLAEGNITQALLSYNHAMWYVDKVKRVASSIEE